MNEDKLNKILQEHKRWLEGLPSGKQADLRDADLRNADLYGAHLYGADLRDADLRNAKLRNAKLRDAYLPNADLRGVDLRGADIRNAVLRGADLQDADLRHAKLQCANLQDADLRYAILRSADLRGVNLQDANLDFSCWPLWCGSLDVKVDVRIARQLAYHFCRLDCDDPEYQAARKAIKDFANKFHRVKECREIKTNDQMQSLMNELSEGEDNE